jgi:phosphoribosylformylglycinamidine synthase
MYQSLRRAIEQGLVRSCHDCSDGGLGIALAESACAGGLGMIIELKKVPAAKITRNDVLLYSETQSRFVVSVSPDKREAFERCMNGTAYGEIGVVTKEPQFRIFGLTDTIVVDADIYVLKECWQKTLRF